jgi:hypothetical protein
MSISCHRARPRLAALVLALLCSTRPGGLGAQSDYDVHQFTTELVWRGDQALTMCNGLFVSGRTPDQVMRQELTSLLYGNRGGLRPYEPMPLDRVAIDYDRAASSGRRCPGPASGWGVAVRS